MQFFIAEEFFLVYWPDEEGVSVVPRKAIVIAQSDDVDVGSESQVRLGKDVYAGKIAAFGKQTNMHNVYFCIYLLASLTSQLHVR